MGSDYTLGDLVEDSGSSSGGSSGGESGGGEWVNELFDRLDEKGYIDQFIAAKMNDSTPEPPAAENHETVNPEGVGGDRDESGGGFTAESLREMMLQLYDHSEEIPGVSNDPKLSELIQLVENQPDLVNQMVQEYT